MPTVMAHALIGATVARLCTLAARTAPQPAIVRRPLPLHLLILAGICSALPDIDVIAFNFGIPYEAPLGHRGFTHSMAFAALTSAMALVCYSIIGKRYRSRKLVVAMVVFLATALHGPFDALTDGGRGVAFFAPFDNTRYFFPLRPLKVSPIGGHFFSTAGLNTLLNECAWIGLPCALILLACKLLPTSR